MLKRYPQRGLFIYDVADDIIKDIMAHLVQRFYLLSKKQHTTVQCYENNGSWIDSEPSVKGGGFICGKDIPMCCISQLVAKKNPGEPITKHVRMRSRDLLESTIRGTVRKEYGALYRMVDRLDGTRICHGKEEQFNTFGLSRGAAVACKFGLDACLVSWEGMLSDTVFNSVSVDNYLPLSFDSFRLRKPLERCVCNIAGKHCAPRAQARARRRNALQKIGIEKPAQSNSISLEGLYRENHFSDDPVELNVEADMVTFRSRAAATGPASFQVIEGRFPAPRAATYHDARIYDHDALFDVSFLFGVGCFTSETAT